MCDGITDPVTLEMLACREALSLAHDLLLTHVIIPSVCQEVVTNIKNNAGGLYWGIIKEIKDTSAQFTACPFIFEGRETNIEAHSLAKHTLGHSLGRHLWLLDPPELNCIPLYLAYDSFPNNKAQSASGRPSHRFAKNPLHYPFINPQSIFK